MTKHVNKANVRKIARKEENVMNKFIVEVAFQDGTLWHHIYRARDLDTARLLAPDIVATVDDGTISSIVIRQLDAPSPEHPAVDMIVDVENDTEKDIPDSEKVRRYNLWSTYGTTDVIELDADFTWIEYLAEVVFFFEYNTKSDYYTAERIAHYIIRGHTELDRDAFLDWLIQQDIIYISENVSCADIDYEIRSIRRIKFE